VARARVPIAFTRIDRFLIGLLVVVAAAVFGILRLSELMVAPPRPRVSESARPTIGLVLRDEPGAIRVRRAAGPAREAGLHAGDTIASIDGAAMRSVAMVADRVAGARAGQTLDVDARRSAAGGGTTGVLAAVRVAVRAVSPADEGLPYEDVSFRNADGLALRGWYLPPPAEGSGRAPAIAYGHGNASDRRDWLPIAVGVHDAGFAQLLFDFTGRGESDGDVISLGAHEPGDLRAALDALAARPEVDPLRLAIAGRSMGGVAAIYLASEDARVKALVLDSPFADLSALVDDKIAACYVPPALLRPVLFKVAGWRAHYSPAAVRPIDVIGKIRAPTLLFHGDADHVVPYGDARRLAAAGGSRVTLVPLSGCDHNSPRPASFEDRIVAFLTRTLPPPGRTP
jgi:pimeloyl-ACP methyl ester carboxylesterase